MSARTTASGVFPPANRVAAPIERAVATAGAMCVIDWKRTSVRPIAPRSSVCPPGLVADEDMVPHLSTGVLRAASLRHTGHASRASYGASGPLGMGPVRRAAHGNSTTRSGDVATLGA